LLTDTLMETLWLILEKSYKLKKWRRINSG
jgi:hypothetical protein